MPFWWHTAARTPVIECFVSSLKWCTVVYSKVKLFGPIFTCYPTSGPDHQVRLMPVSDVCCVPSLICVTLPLFFTSGFSHCLTSVVFLPILRPLQLLLLLVCNPSLCSSLTNSSSSSQFEWHLVVPFLTNSPYPVSTMCTERSGNCYILL